MYQSEMKPDLVTHMYNPCTGRLRLTQENNKIEVTLGYIADPVSKGGCKRIPSALFL